MRKFIKITLYMQELLGDARVKAYFTGKNQTDDIEHREYIQELADTGNVDLILRSFSNAIGRASAVIGEYAPVELDETSDAELTSDNDIVLVVSMPENYNEGLTNTLAQVLHEYLVNSALIDWFAQTMPADSQYYIAQANDNIIKLRNALTRRLRPARSEIVPDIIKYSNTYLEGTTKTVATVTFTDPTTTVARAGTVTNEATTTSDGAITYTSSNSNVAGVGATTGIVTGYSLGTAVITASVPETDTYTAASASYTIQCRIIQQEGDQ